MISLISQYKVKKTGVCIEINYSYIYKNVNIINYKLI